MNKHRIMVVDDEQDALDSIRRGLITAGYKNIWLCNDPRDAAARIAAGECYDAAILDVTMPSMSGVELLEYVKKHSPITECLMVTAVDEARVAVDCLKKGAYDYLVKPISRDELIITLQHALERKLLLNLLNISKQPSPPDLENAKAFESIITGSERMCRVLREAELHAASDLPVLITGESGTGKELLAQAVHDVSPRSKFKFTPINMAAISENLFEAEFFGHTKGAFTGAAQDRQGYFEYTHRGTIFLDEIAQLPLSIQGKLLRILQEGEFLKIGMNTPQRVDVRIIAATNADLQDMAQKDLFRNDLYFRLNSAHLHLPPLRERIDDVPLLAARFLEDSGAKQADAKVEEAALRLLMQYDYPGNIRELKGILQSAFNLSQGGMISPQHLPAHIRNRKAPSITTTSADKDIIPLRKMEKAHIRKVYELTNRNKMQTARYLGIGISTLRRKLKQYGL